MISRSWSLKNASVEIRTLPLAPETAQLEFDVEMPCCRCRDDGMWMLKESAFHRESLCEGVQIEEERDNLDSPCVDECNSL